EHCSWFDPTGLFRHGHPENRWRQRPRVLPQSHVLGGPNQTSPCPGPPCELCDDERSACVMTARSYAAVLLVLCAVLWSTGGLLIKWIAWPALAVAGMRSAIAAIVLLLVLRKWRTRWSWWLGSGALAGAASMLGFVVATKLTTAANAIFLVYTAPLYVALLSPWVLHEPIHRGDWLTLLLTFSEAISPRRSPPQCGPNN